MYFILYMHINNNVNAYDIGNWSSLQLYVNIFNMCKVCTQIKDIGIRNC